MSRGGLRALAISTAVCGVFWAAMLALLLGVPAYRVATSLVQLALWAAIAAGVALCVQSERRARAQQRADRPTTPTQRRSNP